jgi:hypothetical protein
VPLAIAFGHILLTQSEHRLELLVLQRFTKAAVVVALASSIGLHWALFQSLAWVGMVVTYSQQASVTEALAKTFDGKHPCALCKEISKGKQSEKKSDFRPESKKFEFSYVVPVFIFSSPDYFWTARILDTLPIVRATTPPVPPPRFLLIRGFTLI